MSVRNFYVEADIDGRKTMLGGGPAGKTGGMEVTVYQRDEGGISDCIKVECVELSGELKTTVYDKNHNIIFENKTWR